MNHEASDVWEAVRKRIRNVVIEHTHYVETKKKLLPSLPT